MLSLESCHWRVPTQHPRVGLRPAGPSPRTGGDRHCESGLPDDIRHGWANKLSAACKTNCDTDTLVFLPRLSNTTCDGKQLLDPGEKNKIKGKKEKTRASNSKS